MVQILMTLNNRNAPAYPV